MNGAQALIRTLVDSGVDVCFSNPGTSEMHFVAALDAVPEMRGVLALFEGVATGAADGYGRMAERPAASLLHLGPGLGNGLANLHNARRARTPMVTVIGDHASTHARFDAPLQSDISTVARNVSGWIRTSGSPADVGRDGADAVAAAMAVPGQIATLILPADASWGEPGRVAAAVPVPTGMPVGEAVVDELAKVLVGGEPVTLLLGGRSVRERGLVAAGRIAASTGANMVGETFPARLERGAGRPALDRLGYLAEFAQAQLEGTRHLVLVDAASPASFFVYPDKASDLVPAGCSVHVLAAGSEDPLDALERLADAVGASSDAAPLQPALRPERPTGALTGEAVAAALGALLPEGAIVSDEGNTQGLWAAGATAGAPPHDWLTLTGGAIGQGMPVATGAAIACPDRPVVNLEADGSALYTVQSLWTQARENLNVTTIILNNRSYNILQIELHRVGADGAGTKAQDLLDLSRPDIDFVSIANGLGVDAVRPDSAEEFTSALERALREPGPHLVEAVV